MFRAQVELLLDAGFTFSTVADLAAGAKDGEPPAGRVALSFDDGMEDNYSVVLPLLGDYRVPATIYVATGLIGKRNPWLAEETGARMMDDTEVQALAAAGFEVGAHTVSHRDVSQLSREDCLREMVESRLALERLIELPVKTFAYPYCRYSDAAIGAARDAGFVAAVTCGGRGSWSPYEMKRSMITGTDGLGRFVLKVAELYQPLFDSTAGRVVRAATRAPRRKARSLKQRPLA